MKSIRKTTTTKQIAEVLAAKKRVALFSHTNPDGDTVGASVALSLALNKLGIKTQIFCDGILGGKLSSFEAVKNVSKEFFGDYDAFVAVDCGDIYRLGKFSGIYAKFGETLTVDHHGGEYFSRYNCLKNYASTCQIVYEIIRDLGVEIDSDTATYLYMGICTDTCNFSHGNVDSNCLITAADLLNKGADSQRVIRVLLKELTLPELKFRARIISRMRTYYDDKLVVLYITKQDLTDFGLDSSAVTGVVQYAIDLDTSKVGVSVFEYAKDVYKVSMRGKNYNVRAVCSEFGGGGHEFAAGCMISGMFEDVIEKIVRYVGFNL